MKRGELLALLPTLAAGCLGTRSRQDRGPGTEPSTRQATVSARDASTTTRSPLPAKPAGLRTPSADACAPTRPFPDPAGPAEPTPYPDRPASLTEQDVRSYLVAFEAAWRANRRQEQWGGDANVSYDVDEHRVSVQSQGSRYVAEVYLEGAWAFQPIETAETETTQSTATNTTPRPTVTTTPIPSSPNSGTAEYYLTEDGLVRFSRGPHGGARQAVVACS